LEEENTVMMAVSWYVAPRSVVDTDQRFIALIMEALNTSETSVNIYKATQRNIPVGSHNTHRDDLKSHQHRYIQAPGMKCLSSYLQSK
jgi:hypothetical protein